MREQKYGEQAARELLGDAAPIRSFVSREDARELRQKTEQPEGHLAAVTADAPAAAKHRAPEGQPIKQSIKVVTREPEPVSPVHLAFSTVATVAAVGVGVVVGLLAWWRVQHHSEE